MYYIASKKRGVFMGFSSGKWSKEFPDAEQFDYLKGAHAAFRKLLAKPSEIDDVLSIMCCGNARVDFDDTFIETAKVFADGRKPEYIEVKQPKWTVVNDSDGNETFTVEAETAHDAAIQALSTLGWSISAEPEEEDDEEVE